MFLCRSIQFSISVLPRERLPSCCCPRSIGSSSSCTLSLSSSPQLPSVRSLITHTIRQHISLTDFSARGGPTHVRSAARRTGRRSQATLHNRRVAERCSTSHAPLSDQHLARSPLLISASGLPPHPSSAFCRSHTCPLHSRSVHNPRSPHLHQLLQLVQEPDCDVKRATARPAVRCRIAHPSVATFMFPVVKGCVAAAAASAASAASAAATTEGNLYSRFLIPAAAFPYPVAEFGATCIDAATVIASALVPVAAVSVPGFSQNARILKDGEATEWYRKHAPSINIVPPSYYAGQQRCQAEGSAAEGTTAFFPDTYISLCLAVRAFAQIGVPNPNMTLPKIVCVCFFLERALQRHYASESNSRMSKNN